MSDLKSKVAYLQGLANGMNVEADSKEGKLLGGIIDVLDEFAESFSELEESQEQLEDYVETLDEDLYTLENDMHDGEDLEEYMEVDCPRCGETVLFDPGIIEDDDIVEVTCPNCDEVVFVNDDDFEAADEPEMLHSRSRVIEEDI
ncbi:CD1247 N-terminal domain-containing protein [Desulfoscipio sp. XC116]|uniref:CD1247 N-terminal domain-containing protein n=1 Tax=Desulfoscipio sp. XC116 TaxID=3144975 RepID=UPI00325B819C